MGRRLRIDRDGLVHHGQENKPEPLPSDLLRLGLSLVLALGACDVAMSVEGGSTQRQDD